MKSFISLEEAIDILDANVKAIGTEEVEFLKLIILHLINQPWMVMQ